MPYRNTDRMLQKAMQEGYVVGAFNIVDVNSMRAAVDAASTARSPIILQTSQKTVQHYGTSLLVHAAKEFAQESDAEVALTLDHGTEMEVIQGCIRAGWSSVMVDGSSLPYEENVRISREVAQMAHGLGVSVEAELGHIGGKEDHVNVSEEEVLLTEPDQALDFQERTRADSLAVAIGTRHGLYGGKPDIDFARLKKIVAACGFPIVVHGCSGLSVKDLERIIACGPAKMNISTEVKHAYLDGTREYLQDNQDSYEPLDAIRLTEEKIRHLVTHYIGYFQSAGKADLR